MHTRRTYVLSLSYADMRSFVRQDTFDLAVSFYTSFGYFADRGDDERVLGNIYRSLRSGGAVLIDVMSKELVARRFLPVQVTETPNGAMRAARHEIIERLDQDEESMAIWMAVPTVQTRTA